LVVNTQGKHSLRATALPSIATPRTRCRTVDTHPALTNFRGAGIVVITQGICLAIAAFNALLGIDALVVDAEVHGTLIKVVAIPITQATEVVFGGMFTPVGEGIARVIGALNPVVALVILHTTIRSGGVDTNPIYTVVAGAGVQVVTWVSLFTFRGGFVPVDRGPCVRLQAVFISRLPGVAFRRVPIGNRDRFQNVLHLHRTIRFFPVHGIHGRGVCGIQINNSGLLSFTAKEEDNNKEIGLLVLHGRYRSTEVHGQPVEVRPARLFCWIGWRGV